MIRLQRKMQFISMLLVLLMAFGCAPPRQKPNDEEVNTGGSDEIETALRVFEDLGLELPLNDLSAFSENTNQDFTFLPDPNDLISDKEAINNAIDSLELALANMEDPDNSLQGAYVHIYTGYAHILSGVAELQEIDPNIVTLNADESYDFNLPSSPPADVQPVVDAYFLLTGENLVAEWSPPVGDWSGIVNPVDNPDLPQTTSALEELETAIDIIAATLPDADPDELDELLTEIDSGLHGDPAVTNDGSFYDTLIGWGYTPITP